KPDTSRSSRTVPRNSARCPTRTAGRSKRRPVRSTRNSAGRSAPTFSTRPIGRSASFEARKANSDSGARSPDGRPRPRTARASPIGSAMLNRLDRGLSWAEDAFVSTLLITASAILFVNVVARYVFNTGLIWAEEFVRYEIVWLVFIG